MDAMFDGAGQPVDQETAAEAVKWFSEMWGNALFDCGPQDYEFMAKESIAALEAAREDAKDLEQVRRRLSEPTVALAQVKEELDM
jgi:hypothetical protein